MPSGGRHGAQAVFFIGLNVVQSGEAAVEVTVSVAVGKAPDFPFREGEFARAAKFFWRVFDGDARVARVPTAAEIREVEARFPGTIVKPQVREGMKLADLLEQDSYSYAIAYVFIGADDRKGLLNKYVEVQEMLPFEFEPLPESRLATAGAA